MAKRKKTAAVHDEVESQEQDDPKFPYVVNTAEGVYIDGEPVEVGTTVQFSHAEARRHTDAGVSLTLDDEDERKRLVAKQLKNDLVNDAPVPEGV